MKCGEFFNNIDSVKVRELESNLSVVNDNVDVINQMSVDALLDELCGIFISSGKVTFGTTPIRSSKSTQEKHKRDNKPWFDVDCKFARKNFRKLKRKFKTNRSRSNYNNMKQAEARYKKTLDEKYKLYCKNLSKNINDMKSNNSKEFWRFLKNSKKKCQPNIDISKLYEFFKNLNTAPQYDDRDELPDIDNPDLDRINNDLNSYITRDEIYNCIRKLKNDKACGEDHIVNEYIKSTSDQFIGIYEKLFNIIFDTGLIPNSWVIGTIKPIYKNKGDFNDPKNYRPITIVSCLGKLFTSVLCNRLNEFSNEYCIIKENQCGFRQNYSTLDSIFTLYMLFEIMKCKKKKLYCAFIDFEKAFDTVWREGLFYKMLLNNIHGKMYNVILSMYSSIKSCISYNNFKSDYFPCENGVRQGENLSPFLFSIFLNDLEDYLISKNIVGLNTITENIEHELDTYIKIFIMLYADDTVLLAETPTDLQDQLNYFYEYCTKWKLKVNVGKTKVMIFGMGRILPNINFSYNNIEIEIVKEFNYLGVLLTKTGNFGLNKKYLADKALIAMYEILKFGRTYNLSVKLQLDLFDKMILPILLYGCEIWGFGDNQLLEKIHLKFCKVLLNLKQSTPSFMVYGELGRHPIDIDIKVRTVMFWARLLNSKQEKFSRVLYNLLYCLNTNQNVRIKWIENVKNIFNTCGFNYVWETQNFINKNWLKSIVKQRLIDQFLQDWYSLVQNSPKSTNYRIFKTELKFEEYFNILDIKNAIVLCRFRTTNHKLPIETGRWQNVMRQNRICLLCNTNSIGDEFHYILECNYFSDKRREHISKTFTNRPNILKFCSLFTNKRKPVLLKLCKLIRCINSCVYPPG